MATGTMILGDSKFAITEESTEGTYVAPSATTDYFQANEGLTITPSKDLLERSLITSGIGKATPRTGLVGVTASLPLELRGSGTEGEGDAYDFDLLYESMMGNRRQLTSRITSGTTHTTTVVNVSDTSNLNVGDIVVILESGAHHVSPIVTVTTNTSITLLVAAGSAFSDSVEIAKFTTYYPADSGHKALSLSAYWADTIREAAIGCKVASWSLESFETGQLATQTFSLEGLDFTQVDGAAPQTPAYDSQIPPTILNACIYQDGTQIPINTLTLNIENTLGFVKSTCDSNGKIRSNLTARSVTGSINPYKDDTSVDQHSKFDNNTTFSLFASVYTPSSTAGEFSLGSVWGVYMPTCLPTEIQVGNVDNVLTDNITFQATAGSDGTSDDVYFGLI